MRRATCRFLSVVGSKVVSPLEHGLAVQHSQAHLSALSLPSGSAAFTSARDIGSSLLRSLLHAQRQAAPMLSAAGQQRFIGCGMNACSADIAKMAPKVLVEYDRNMVDTFIELADQIEEAMPHVLVEGNLGLPDGRPGSFEICTEDGSVIYSKLSDPKSKLDYDQIVSALITKIPAAEASS